MPTHYKQNNVYKICTCDYVNMCGTADSLVLTQCVAMQMVLYIMRVQQYNWIQLFTVCVCWQNSTGQEEYQIQQQTETHRQRVITHHTFKRTAQTIL